MEESVTRGLFNADSLSEAAKGKVRAIDVYLLKENRLNEVFSQDDIDLLKENIEEFQLSQPLVVKRNTDGSYTIISGHRRYKACKKLFDEGKVLRFFDKEYINQIPCILDESNTGMKMMNSWPSYLPMPQEYYPLMKERRSM